MAPTMWNSGRGTAINVGGLQGQQLQRVQTLANAGYGTRAQNIANTLNTRIPKAPTPTPTNTTTNGGIAVNGGTGVQTPITSNIPPAPPLSNPNGAMPGETPEQAAARNAAGNTAEQAVINGTAPPVPAGQQAPGTGTQPGGSSVENGAGNILFPGNFEQNYTGDPLYNWQLQQGLKQEDASLASRGLFNSGKGIRDELNVQGQTAANATDREQQLATDNANRYQAYQFNAGARQDNQTQNQWNNVLNLAQLMSNQSPYQSGLQGLTQTGQLTQAQANAFAQFLASQAKGGRGGGGGHGGAAPTPIPLPSGPDYSNITPLEINGEAASNNGRTNILNTLFNSIFPPQTNVGAKPAGT